MFSIASVVVCFIGRAAAHEPPAGTGVYERDEQLIVRTSRGLVASRSAERRDFRFLCNEALGSEAFDVPSVLLQADGSLLVGTSAGLKRVSADLCTIEPTLALANARVTALVRDPHDSAHVFAATDLGLYESRDEGASFEQLDWHAFDSLEVPQSAPDSVFAAGQSSSATGQRDAFFARWQSGRAIEMQAFALAANEFGVALLGSDADRVFAVARAYLGTNNTDRFLVSDDNARSWHNPFSTLGISAFVIDPATKSWLVASTTGLWRASPSGAPEQLRTDAISCLALSASRLYLCDGAGAEGGLSQSRDGGEHWSSVLRWNQLSGLPACASDAPVLSLCEAAWQDWQAELPQGPSLTGSDDPNEEPADASAVAREAQTDAAAAEAASCAAVSGRSHGPGGFTLGVFVALLYALRRLPAKRSAMTKTTHHVSHLDLGARRGQGSDLCGPRSRARLVALAASLALALLSACAKDPKASQAGSTRGDAGPDAASDSGTTLEPNMLPDAAMGGSDADVTTGGSSGTAGDQNRAGSSGRAGDPSAPEGGRGDDTSHGGSGGQAEVADAGPEPDSDSGPDVSDDICTSCGGCEQTIKVVSTMHTNDVVKYADPPPTSGPHNPCWARWGIHDEPLRADRWVHNLEHGGVVFLYNCPGGCDAEINKLRDIVSVRARTILAAYDDLPTRFGVVSWGHRLISDCYDEAAFLAFYKQNFDHAPEANANPPNPGCPP